ncbi:MAG TPA: TetR/AcrR family transcriptional regulator [Nitrospinota bacterium]|nr:TetR/AcrR family transcriptional regulator [Nitrospinota bacterium]
MSTLSRKEREYLARRDEILESAQKLFAQKGFFKTTIQDIARESEFAIATLYNFFKSKDELYSALIERKTENLFKFIQESALNQEGIKKIDNVVYAVLEFFENDKDFFKLYVIERSGFEWDIRSEIGERCHKMYLEYIEFLKSVIEESIERGELRERSPWDISFFLSGIINSFIFQWVNSPKPYSLLDKHKTIMELFLSGVKKE